MRSESGFTPLHFAVSASNSSAGNDLDTPRLLLMGLTLKREGGGASACLQG